MPCPVLENVDCKTPSSYAELTQQDIPYNGKITCRLLDPDLIS